jgi:replicative DNA helicase
MAEKVISTMNSESEKVLLAHCLRFPENMAIIFDGLKSEDFLSPKHRILFQAIREHPLTIGRIDKLLLSNTLKSKGWNIEPSELITLEDDYGFDGLDIDYHKREVILASQRRHLADFLSAQVKEIEEGNTDFEAVKGKLLDGINTISSDSFKSNCVKGSEAFFDEIRDLHSGRAINKAIPSGWKTLDDLLGGFRSNELSILTGETGSGKTTWAANLGYRFSKAGHPVLIASFEMKPLAIIRKMVAMETAYSFYDLKKEELESSLKTISFLPLHFIDIYGEIGITELRNSIYYAKRRHGIKLVILDHLHFFLRYAGDQERQAIDQALRDIKSWAMDLNIHIILIVHPTKLTYDNKVVHLNDLKGSSGLKQIPDNVLSIWRSRDGNDLKNPQNEIILYILKVRDDEGDEGKVILTFDKRSQGYEDSGPGLARPVEGRVSPDSSSPRSRVLSGKDLSSGYDQ